MSVWTITTKHAGIQYMSSSTASSCKSHHPCQLEMKLETCQHTHTRLTAVFLGLPGWVSTRKVKPIWILLKQETVSGSGISWAICKSAPRSRQITISAPHHSVFLQYGCPSCRPTYSVKALKAWLINRNNVVAMMIMKICAMSDLWIPSQPQGITAPWLVPNFIAICANNMPRLLPKGRMARTRTCDLLYSQFKTRTHHYISRNKQLVTVPDKMRTTCL